MCFADAKALTLLSSYVGCISHERSQPGGGGGPLEDMLGSAILSLDMDERKQVQASIGWPTIQIFRCRMVLSFPVERT